VTLRQRLTVRLGRERGSQIWLNGRDLSPLLRGLTLEQLADGAPVLTLHCSYGTAAEIAPLLVTTPEVDGVAALRLVAPRVRLRHAARVIHDARCTCLGRTA
jgi:hypothetical protein